MTIGDGIFYSSLVLSVVALYVATRERKIFFRLFGSVVGMLVIYGGAIYYLQNVYEEQPRKETSFWGIELGASKSDVTFLKGNPITPKLINLSDDELIELEEDYETPSRSEIENALRNAHNAGDTAAARRLADALVSMPSEQQIAAKPQPKVDQGAPIRTEEDVLRDLRALDAPSFRKNGKWDLGKLSDDELIELFHLKWWHRVKKGDLSGLLPGSHEDMWVYPNMSSEQETLHLVSFKGGKVDAVQHIGPARDAPSIQGITVEHSDYADIKGKFGEPTLVSRNEDDTARILSYAHYNLVFILRKNEIESLGIFDGERRPGLRFKKEAK